RGARGRAQARSPTRPRPPLRRPPRPPPPRPAPRPRRRPARRRPTRRSRTDDHPRPAARPQHGRRASLTNRDLETPARAHEGPEAAPRQVTVRADERDHAARDAHHRGLGDRVRREGRDEVAEAIDVNDGALDRASARAGAPSTTSWRATSWVTSTSCTARPAVRTISRIAPFISATYGSRTPKSVVSVTMASNPSDRRPSAVPIHDEVRHERERLALLRRREDLEVGLRGPRVGVG